MGNVITEIVPAAEKDAGRATVPTAVAGTVAGTLLAPMAVFAESTSGNVTSGMTTALQTAFSAVQADAISIITTALPYALAIMGTVLAVRIGVRFFRSSAR